MKTVLKQISIAAASVTIGLAALTPAALAAGSATLSFSPSSGSVIKGKTLTVGVYEDSGSDSVNAVQANFTYPDTLLSFTSISSSSNFGVDAQDYGTNGVVKIGRGTISAVSGKKLVATVYFKALASGGTAALDFDTSTSKVVRSSDSGSESLTVQNASFSLKAAASSGGSGSSSGSTSNSGSGSSKSSSGTSSSSSSSSGSSSSSSSSTKSSGQSSTKTKAKTLTISGVAITNLSSDTATIVWKTSIPASSEVDYGNTSSYGLTAVDSKLTTSHSVMLNSNDLRPSLVYHYAVKSTDAGGHVATSPDSTFETSAEGAINLGTSASSTTSYKFVAFGVVALIAAAALAAAWHIRHLHAAASATNSHIFMGPASSSTAPPPTVNITTPSVKAPNQPKEPKPPASAA